MHLEGNALDLYSWMSADQPMEYWEELVRALQKNFGPAEFQNPDEHLCDVKQTGTVQEYRQEFAKRSSRVQGWPDHCLLGVFLSGLKEELRADVRIHKPRSVYKAMSIALEFEAKLSHTRPVKNMAEIQVSKGGQQDSKQGLTTQLHASGSVQQPANRLSEAEKQSRYVRGECFRCGDKYGPGHRCKTSSLKLLEAEDIFTKHHSENDAEMEELAEISLHAIMGITNHTTLVIAGDINESKVSVLIDCGSTHNFINDSLIQKLGLSTQDIAPFGVRIGNGDLIRCHQICRNIKMRLNDLEIIQDFYPFALGGADVVLGIQWLATLNTVQANWKSMFLKFTCNGRDYKLEGKPLEGTKSAATFRNLTIETLGEPPDEHAYIRLEDKSCVKGGSIDSIPAPKTATGCRPATGCRHGSNGGGG